MWLPRGAPVHLPAFLFCQTLQRIPKARPNTESVTIWIEPEDDGHLPAEVLHAKREGVNVRPASPVLESFAVIVRSMRRKEHLSQIGFERLVRLAYGMNANGKQRIRTIEQVLAGSSETAREAPAPG